MRNLFTDPSVNWNHGVPLMGSKPEFHPMTLMASQLFNRTRLINTHRDYLLTLNTGDSDSLSVLMDEYPKSDELNKALGTNNFVLTFIKDYHRYIVSFINIILSTNVERSSKYDTEVGEWGDFGEAKKDMRFFEDGMKTIRNRFKMTVRESETILEFLDFIDQQLHHTTVRNLLPRYYGNLTRLKFTEIREILFRTLENSQDNS